MKIQCAAISDVGKKRTINEDNFFMSKKLGLFMIADGMGGHLAGDMASKIAADMIADFIKSTTKDHEVTWPFQRDEKLSYNANRLVVAIKLANKRINNIAREKNLEGMGTTIASILFTNDYVNICHVGDSRVYRLRSKKLMQLTEDHSLLSDTIKEHKLSDEEIQNFPFKNVITRALGIEDNVDVDTKEELPKSGDYYMLCTDGLSNMVPNDKIKEILLQNEKNLMKSCKSLVSFANQKGGNDNITAVLIHFT